MSTKPKMYFFPPVDGHEDSLLIPQSKDGQGDFPSLKGPRLPFLNYIEKKTLIDLNIGLYAICGSYR